MPENPNGNIPLPAAPPQSQEVHVDANLVINVLRQQISELTFQNALLQAQLMTKSSSG